jgi:tetratricopeptide (TPR) repeat protein
MAEPAADDTSLPTNAIGLSDIALPTNAGESAFFREPPPLEEATVVRDYGRYRMVRHYAQGGLGRVCLARDPRLGRTVALKEIRPDHPLTPALRARFVNEAAITGQLEHPGIVPVYTLDEHPDGQPFYAMRFIQGRMMSEAIVEYHQAPTPLVFRDLLQRFISVCQTIAFAHSKGVIHRDLKPDNIMLGDYGETLVVDWGLAKQLQPLEKPPPLVEENSSLQSPSSELTQAGQVVGTPAYMAPEQACADHAWVGPAADVYALGALLYSLLTCKAPFSGSALEVIRGLQKGARPEPVRHLKPNSPAALVAICDKAMALIPQDRYATPVELARDIERWLADEPVSAWQEPWQVRCRRWVRRHRTLVVTASVALILLLAAGLLLTGLVQHYTRENLTQAQEAAVALARERDQTEAQRQQAERERQKAQQEQQKAEQERQKAQQEQQKAEQALAGTRAINSFLRKEVLRAARPRGNQGGLGRNATLRQVIDAAAPKISQAFGGQPRLEADVCHELGSTYHTLGVYDRAETLLRRAIDLRQTHLGPEHLETLESRCVLGVILLDAGRRQEAEKLLADVEATLRRKYGPNHPDSIRALENVGALFAQQGRYAEAVTRLRKVYEVRLPLGPEHPDLLTTMSNLGNTLSLMGRFAEAEELLRKVWEVRQRVLGPIDTETLNSLLNLSIILQKRGKLREAEPLLKEAVETRVDLLGQEHPITLQLKNDYGHLLHSLGRPKEAEPILRQTLEIQRRTLGADHPDTLATLNNLAGVFIALTRHAEAEKLLREAWIQQQRHLGAEHPDTLITQNNLASILRDLDRMSEADLLQQQVLEIRRRTLGSEHPDTLTSLHNQAISLVLEEKHAQAVTLFRQLLETRRRLLGPDHPETLTTQGCLASALRDLQLYKEAEPLYVDALKRRKDQLGPGHPETLALQGQYAIFLYELKRFQEAEPLFRQVIELQRKTLGEDDQGVLACQNYLAQICRQTNRLEEAETLLRPLPAATSRVFGPNHPTPAIVSANLAAVLVARGKAVEAEPLYRQAWDLFRRRFGPKHPDALRYQGRLADTLLRQKKYPEAEPLLVERYNLLAQIKEVPAKDLRTAAAQLVKLYEAWGKPDQAATWRKKVE